MFLCGVPNVERHGSPYHTKNERMLKNLPTYLSVYFAMDDECEILRMKKTTNELESIVSSLNFGSEDIPFEE